MILSAFFLPAISCQSTPPAYDDPPPVAAQQGPGQDELARLDAAMARATGAREEAAAVRASVHFPDEWAQAESDYQAGRRAGRATSDAVNQAVASFNSAADLYGRLATDSAPLFAGDLQDARRALEAATARARRSRQEAVNSQGQTHFPSEWQAAETSFQRGEDTERETFGGIESATALYVAAADGFDGIAERSRPLMAQDRDNAQQAMQAALARAEQSRNAAVANRASAHFTAEWRDAEAQLRTGRAAGRGTPDEMRAATTLLTSLAATYDDLANRSRPLFEMDEAQRGLTTAITRAERSRRAAMNVNGQTFFPNDWRNAEAQNQAGIDSPRNTTAEIQAATARFTAAADGYDDIARRSGPLFAAARNDATATLQAATTRADGSRRAAMEAEAQTHFPAEWRDAETQNSAARRARRTTPEEMLEAAALLNAVADNYDRLAQRSGPIFARERGAADNALQAAMTRAQRSRQAAIDAEGQTHMPAEWRNAEGQNNAANRARRTTTAEIQAAATLFTTAADSYDDIARRSGAVATAARNDANRDFQAATARADASRRAAVAVEAQTHFPRDWERAETQNTTGRSAPRNTVAETRAAAAQLNSAADGFDNIAQRSGALAARAREEADRALQTAMTRAERSRQAA
ncbi:MAG: hypothetical protein FWD88_04725, partial [Treponema sp.]|nr:hypothetical protein [Treponema sp.]